MDVYIIELFIIGLLLFFVTFFSCGLKIIRPLSFKNWQITIRLIVLLMPISIFALAIAGKLFLGMDWGVAILLGAILAPTDPVLASEVQLTDFDDEDEMRFGLTSEGGLNDALAFPFVYFGLYAIKDNNWNNWLKSWFSIDVFWAIAAGIVMGILVAKGAVAMLFPITWREPFGLVMIESMAAGTPVIAMNMGSASEVITHGKTGFICTNVEECVSAIALAAKLDRYAIREYVSQRFGVQQMVDGYEAVYQQVLAEKIARNGHLRAPAISRI